MKFTTNQGILVQILTTIQDADDYLFAEHGYKYSGGIGGDLARGIGIRQSIRKEQQIEQEEYYSQIQGFLTTIIPTQVRTETGATNPLYSGGKGTIPAPKEWKDFGDVIGVSSGRPFFGSEIGLPIRTLSTKNVRITARGVSVVTQHTDRFGYDPDNVAQIQRLRDIVAGKIPPTQVDLNYYTHELREFVRYRYLGYPSGEPVDPDLAHRLWSNLHTATLEDYDLTGATSELYFTEIVP